MHAPTMTPARARIRGRDARVGFCALSWLLILDHELSDGAMRTYCVLIRHAIANEEVWPSQNYVARARGLALRTIQSHIAELVERGLVTVDPPDDARATNTYWFESPASVNGDAAVKLAERIPSSDDLDELLALRAVEVAARPKLTLPADWETTGTQKTASPPMQNSASPPMQNSASKGVLIKKQQEGEGSPPSGGDIPTTVSDQATRENEGGESEGEKTDVASGEKGTQLGATPGVMDAPEVLNSAASVGNAESSPPASAAQPKKAKRRRLAIPDGATQTGEQETYWPPATGEHVYKLWMEELEKKEKVFDGGFPATPSGKERKLGATLLAKFHPEEAGDTLLKVLRVAIWDWGAIQLAVEPWYTGKKPIPTLEAIVYLADTLMRGIGAGFTAPPNIRVSNYVEKWIKPTPTEPTDEIGRAARAAGLTRAEYVLNQKEAERAARRAKSTG